MSFFSTDVNKQVQGSTVLRALDLAGVTQMPSFGKKRTASSLRAVFSPLTPSSPGCGSPSAFRKVEPLRRAKPSTAELAGLLGRSKEFAKGPEYIYGYVSKTSADIATSPKTKPASGAAANRARGHRRSKTEPATVYLEFLVTLDEEGANSEGSGISISPAPGQSARASKILANKMMKGHRRTKSDISSIISRGKLMMEDVYEDAELKSTILPRFGGSDSILGDGNALMSGSAISQMMQEPPRSRVMPKGPLGQRIGQRTPVHRRVASDPAFLRSAVDIDFAAVDETPPTTLATSPTPPPITPTGDGLLGVSPTFFNVDYQNSNANYCFNCRSVGHLSKACPNPCTYCKQIGHWSQNCPNTGMRTKTKGARADPNSLLCFNCKQPGHRSAQCKAPCQYCSSTDHWSKNCSQRVN